MTTEEGTAVSLYVSTVNVCFQRFKLPAGVWDLGASDLSNFADISSTQISILVQIKHQGVSPSVGKGNRTSRIS